MRILLIASRASDVSTVEAALAQGSGPVDVERCHAPADALERLTRVSAQAILLALDGAGWAEDLAELRAQVPDVPVLALTDDEDAAVQAVQAGAQDALPRGAISSAMLARALRLTAPRHWRSLGTEQLAAIARHLTEGLDRQSVAKGIVEGVLALFGPGAVAGLWDLMPDGAAVVLAIAGHAPPPFGVGYVVPPGQGITGRALREGRAVQTLDVLEDAGIALPADLRQRLLASPVRSLIAIPLRAGGRPVGVLSIGIPRATGFPDGQVDLLQAFADHAALAVQHAHLYEAATRSQERYRAIVEGSIQGVVIHRDAGILFVNPALVRLLGYASAAQLVGRSATGFIAPEDRERLLAYRDARQAGRAAPERYEFRALHQAGHSIVLDCIVSPITWDGGPATLATMIDVTERRRLEDQLRQSQKMEAIGQLAGGVAHDFNNLLTVILARSQLLGQRLVTQDPLRREADIIGRTAERAAALTRQLLAFSRRQLLQPTVLDVGVVVADLVPVLQRMLGEDVEIQYQPGSPPGVIRADRTQLEQVIMNLAVNARDAMPEGGSLTIELTEADLGPGEPPDRPAVPPGRYVVLAVTDTGVGMDAATQARIFEPFFTTKGPGQGTGMGLATVYGIVQQSGGHIRLASEPGRGSTFAIYLPRLDRTEAAPSAGRAPRAEGRGGSETILLVEDEEDVRELAREVLGSRGYRVLVAPEAREALLVAQRHTGPIDLLVTDMVMPRMSGARLADLLSAQRPGVRVLFISGYTNDAVMRDRDLARGRGFLQKPFAPGDLAHRVRDLLDG